MTIKDAVCRANIELATSGLVTGTFGNLSIVDRAAGVFAIKPSGVPYEALTPEAIVVISIESGAVVDGSLRPSSDAPTHLEIYRAFTCGAIAHTHSEFATVFAQAQTPIRCMGTTHADHFRGDVPVTRPLTPAEVEEDYETHTGKVIVETFAAHGLSADDVPAVLVAHHAPFTWGRDGAQAIDHARMLELVARLAWRARLLAPAPPPPGAFLVDKHHRRKHGTSAYYGQTK